MLLKFDMGQVILCILWFSTVSVIPPVLHACAFIHLALTLHHLSNCKHHYIKKVFTTMRPSHPTHNYIHTYICSCSFCNTITTLDEEKREGGREGGMCIYLHFPNFLGHRILFNLVNSY
jgi:hypothetical protein